MLGFLARSAQEAPTCASEKEQTGMQFSTRMVWISVSSSPARPSTRTVWPFGYCEVLSQESRRTTTRWSWGERRAADITSGSCVPSIATSRKAADLQRLGLLGADANLRDAAIPGNRQDVLGVPALGLRRIPGRKRNHVIPPVPLQDPHNAACGSRARDWFWFKVGPKARLPYGSDLLAWFDSGSGPRPPQPER